MAFSDEKMAFLLKKVPFSDEKMTFRSEQKKGTGGRVPVSQKN